MKDYKDVKLPKGLVGYESENGYNNWWYPAKDCPIEIPMDCTARHLHLWRNQDPMVVFSIPMCVFKPEKLFDEGKKQYVAVWFHKEDIDEILDRQIV